MTTRLNESMRQAFVKSVLDDTPKVDYAEQRRKLIQDFLVDLAPPEILKMYKNPKLKVYMRPDNVTYETGIGRRSSWSWGKFWLVPDIDGGSTYEIKDAKLLVQLTTVDTADREQDQQREALRKKLEATIAAFNTVKQARDAMPEFHKYLPDPEAATCKTLPAITGLVADLMKAGWPKKEAEAKAKAQLAKGKSK